MESKRNQHASRLSDEQLIDAANSGDVDAVAKLYKRYQHWVTDLAYRFTRDSDLALDVLQETFEYVLSKFPDFVLEANMKTFLYPVVRHIAISSQSKAKRLSYGDNLPPSQALAIDPEAEESRAQLAAVMDSLPDHQYEILILRYADGLSLAQIATAMRIPLGTVKSRLHSALTAMRENELTKKYFDL